MQDKNQKEFLSTYEFAQEIGVSRVTVFKKIKTGEIPAKRVGRSYIIRRSDVGRFISGPVDKKTQRSVDEAVKKTVKEYGETLRLLGKE